MNYRITVFTPIYNRAYIIDKLYQSLKRQKLKNFEWVIVDDGSQDNIDDVINNYKKEKIINIRYIKVTNGGKHRAINIGVEEAKGEYFFIVDSDDYLTDNSIEVISYWLDTIENNCKNIIGVGGIKSFENGVDVGKTFKGKYIDCSNLERDKFKILGDKAEVIKTEILKKYKFPEIPNEKFLGEDVVWNRIANDGYKIRWFNQSIYICEYIEDGLTNMGDKKLIDNFIGYTLRMKELLNYEIPIKQKKLKLMKYCRIAIQKGKKFEEICKSLNLNKKNIIIEYILASIYIKLKDKRGI